LEQQQRLHLVFQVLEAISKYCHKSYKSGNCFFYFIYYKCKIVTIQHCILSFQILRYPQLHYGHVLTCSTFVRIHQVARKRLQIIYLKLDTINRLCWHIDEFKHVWNSVKSNAKKAHN
jgi:hypothetical protein